MTGNNEFEHCTLPDERTTSPLEKLKLIQGKFKYASTQLRALQLQIDAYEVEVAAAIDDVREWMKAERRAQRKREADARALADAADTERIARKLRTYQFTAYPPLRAVEAKNAGV